MDTFTEKHLRKWLEHQFSQLFDLEARFTAMQRVVAEYPDLENGDSGWWRVYEVALNKGYVVDND